MEEKLSLDNILGADEIENLFVDNEPDDTQLSSEDLDSKQLDNEDKKDNTTEVVDVDTLFTDKPESVGSGKDIKENEEDTNSQKDIGTSPKHNFYSSIAKALKEEGIFQTLEDKDVSQINSPEEFVEALNKQVQSMFDERQKRIDSALNAGIEPSEIQRYESTISYLNSLQDSDLTDESEKGEKLRQKLIYTDFINRGYSEERAQREVQKSFNSGSDIEDAKEALASNKEFFKSEYDNLIKDAQEEEKKEAQERKEQAEKLKKSILEDNNIFGDIQVDKITRQKIFDNISKPIYKDPNTGELFTAIQKYEMENRTEFLKNISLLFTLTDGFKDFNKLVKSKVFASGINDDMESFINKGWDLDV